MDYITLKKHILDLSAVLKSRPIVVRAYDRSGRSIFLRLKTDEGIKDLCISLDSPNQGLWLSNHCDEVEKNSLIVRSLNRLLINSRLFNIELAGKEEEGQFDRVVKLHFVHIDEYFGNRSDFYIFCEFTGRISDVFFCDGEFKILDRISRTSNNLVGNLYRLPDSYKLMSPYSSDKEQQKTVFAAPSEEWVNKIGIVSPIMTREILFRSSNIGDTPENYSDIFKEILDECLSNTVYLYKKENKLQAISVFELKHLFEQKTEPLNIELIHFKSVNEAMNYVEQELVGPKRLVQEKKRIVAQLNRSLKQKKELLDEQFKLKTKYENSDKYQNLGNLIIANLYRIKPGTVHFEAEDWNSGETINIELDPSKTAAANAKKFFNLHKKSKRGVIEVEKRIQSLQSDIKWLEEQIWLAENAEIETWLQVEENTKTKRIEKNKEKNTNNKNSKNPKQIIKPTLEENGCKYYVGHNAKQNDHITFKIGKKGDIWFHANDVPGAHVILKKIEGSITKEDIFAGARLAAINSFARNSSKVPVDYTDVSNVKRIPNGGAGQVSYTNQHTIMVVLP